MQHILVACEGRTWEVVVVHLRTELPLSHCLELNLHCEVVGPTLTKKVPLSAIRPTAGIMCHMLDARPLEKRSYTVQALAGVRQQAAAAASVRHRPGSPPRHAMVVRSRTVPACR